MTDPSIPLMTGALNSIRTVQDQAALEVASKGSNQQLITYDDYDEGFPHISFNGR
jgi:hypothetical protein